MKNSQSMIEIIPSVWQKTMDHPGPTITILGGTHGNETDGVKVVNQILLYAIMNEIRCGTLNLGYGNPTAIKAGKRFLENDLNRCFGQNPTNPNVEEVRAKELEKVLSETDVLLDIHSTIKPSKPFVCIPKLDHPHAKHLHLFGIPTIITGEGLLPPDKKPIYTDTFVNAHGGFGATLETGQQGENNKIAEIRKGVLSFIQAFGIFDEELTHPIFPEEIHGEDGAPQEKASQELEYWDAYWNVIAGSDFAFTQEWANFQKLSPGTYFATSDGKKLIVPEMSIVLFPKPAAQIVTGQEACIIARKMELGVKT